MLFSIQTSQGRPMKGIVFTEFLGMVRQVFSEDMADDIIDDAQLSHGGAYTAVGTYPFSEMVAMLGALSRRSGLDIPSLLHAFGQHLFGRFAVLYPHFITQANDTLALVASIEQVIHSEVRKLYPDAELPSFRVEHYSPQQLRIVYQSPRCLSVLARGLIDGALLHYHESETVQVQQIPLDSDGREVRFILDRI